MYAFTYDHHLVNGLPCSLSERFLTFDELYDWLSKLVQRELTHVSKIFS